MADLPFFSSSQGSQYEQNKITLDQENCLPPPSSPPPASRSSPVKSNKLRKPPTVTPKRFTKFFTPRISASSRNARQSRAGRQLRDITKNGGNRRRNLQFRSSPKLENECDDDDMSRPLKRRRCSLDYPSSPPLQSSPLKHVQPAPAVDIFEEETASPCFSDEDALSELLEQVEAFPKPVRRLRYSGPTDRILQRSFGGHDALTRGWRGNDHGVQWYADAANFATTPSDIHSFSRAALPFCTASCNTNSLIAVGEEEGGVRLIDSAPSSDFGKPYVAFKPHSNAIMDITFSPDDYLFATASGDQTARIIDMHTQNTICILSGHKSSVKQVRFHPNDDNTITTSSRDGSVMIWDMRCGGRGSVQALRTALARNVDTGTVEPTVRFAKHIFDVGSAFRSKDSATSSSSSAASKYPESAGVSITSIQHLSHGREHLLLTTSELNASVKVWDLRNAGRRGGLSVPLSSTLPPPSHQKTRNYGVNAMFLSTDGARLYTSCRDSVVYAYSTNHLVLGCATEISSATSKGKILKTSKIGVGPLYGFKHPSFRSASFYVKAALRPAGSDRNELLAVGSSDGTPVVFPTDERYLPRGGQTRHLESERDDDDAELPLFLPLSSSPKLSSSAAGTASMDTQIHSQGLPLVGAHDKEVTSLTWTHGGELVTVSDDFTVRCWRENAAKARELRTCRRPEELWRCGWAEMEGVDREFDDDEG